MAQAQCREKLILWYQTRYSASVWIFVRSPSIPICSGARIGRPTSATPSYKTIGHAIGMSENTVAKYVRQLEEKGLIYTEPTMVRSKDGRPLNGNLLYTVRPIQGVLEAFYERQLRQVEEATARYRVAELLKKSNAQGRQNALCAPFREEASPSPDQGIEAGCEPFSADFCGTKEKSRIKAWRRRRRRSRHFCPQCGQFRRLKLASLRDEKSADGVSFPKSPVLQGFSRMSYSKKGGIE